MLYVKLRRTLRQRRKFDTEGFIPVASLYGVVGSSFSFIRSLIGRMDIFQSRFGKIDQFGWWDLERISADAGTQFTSTDFKEECQTRGVCLTLAETEH